MSAPRRVGVTAIIELGDGVLVDRRRDDGSWAFVGGGIEDDESVTAALTREVEEETGLDVASCRLLGVFSDPGRLIGYDDGTVQRILTFAFVVTPRDGTTPRASAESRELAVVPRGALAALPLWPAASPVLDAYLADDGTVVVA
ncbi:MAG: NUDIX hydrolase [Gaiella sp.]